MNSKEKLQKKKADLGILDASSKVYHKKGKAPEKNWFVWSKMKREYLERRAGTVVFGDWFMKWYTEWSRNDLEERSHDERFCVV